MRKDAIFRMASMSKPVTGVAILMLLEEGKVRLNDPVSRFIPGVQGHEGRGRRSRSARRRGAPAPAAAAEARPRRRRRRSTRCRPSREITVRDLLTHTSGLESGGAGSREGGAHRAARHERASWPTYIPKLGAAPLDFQPGTAVALQLARRHGNARPHRRGRVGHDVRSVPEAAHLRSARHEGHRRSIRPTTSCRASRRSTSGRTAGSRTRRDARLARHEDAVLWRRRTVVHGRGLPAVRADAGERRAVERQAPAQPADRGPDGVESRRRSLSRPGRPRRAWAWA